VGATQDLAALDIDLAAITQAGGVPRSPKAPAHSIRSKRLPALTLATWLSGFDDIGSILLLPVLDSSNFYRIPWAPLTPKRMILVVDVRARVARGSLHVWPGERSLKNGYSASGLGMAIDEGSGAHAFFFGFLELRA
jgi:hypothetical protein